MRRLVACVAVIASALGVAMQLAPAVGAVGTATELTAEQRRARAKTTAWIVTWDRARVVASLRANRDRVGRISPYWFRLRPDGSRLESREGAMDREVLAIAGSRRVLVVPTVTNEFDAVRVTAMLRTAQTRARHVEQLANLADDPRFDGIDLDYELVAASDRARFTAFVRALASALHARGRTLSVSIPPVTSDATAGASAYDHAAIGAVADEVRVLAYDYSSYCGGAGPIAPIDWVEDVVTYLLGDMDRRKLVLGVPLYGYDWPRTGCATSRTWRDTTAIRLRRGGVLGWSVPWQSRRMRYTTGQGARRLVWFEDSAATSAKAKLVEEHRIRGLALWRIGGEDPRTWRVLEDVLGRPRP